MVFLLNFFLKKQKNKKRAFVPRSPHLLVVCFLCVFMNDYFVCVGNDLIRHRK